MIGQIDIWINRAEKNWLNELDKHARDLFKETFLPSHDSSHHLRVWNISKTLLREIATFNQLLDQSLVEGLLVAIYFHDLGMVRSTREDHGLLGRDLCEKYFKHRAGTLPPRFNEILDSIENHDVKIVGISTEIRSSVAPSILDILTVADDLEAFGIIGIFRYSEIYLLRNINLKNLGIRVLGNAVIRFKNLTKSCILCPNLMKDYRYQYEYLVDFFDHYNQQIVNEHKVEEVFWGHLGVVNYIRTIGLNKHTNPIDILSKTRNRITSSFVTDFFTSLNNELDNARQ